MNKKNIKLRSMVLAVCLLFNQSTYSFSNIMVRDSLSSTVSVLRSAFYYVRSYIGDDVLKEIKSYIPYFIVQMIVLVCGAKIMGSAGVMGKNFIPCDSSKSDDNTIPYMGEIPKEIVVLIKSLKNSKNNSELSKGFVLTGKPGSGKTFLAREIARQLHGYCSVFIIEPGDLLGSILGQTESNIIGLFNQARNAAKNSRSGVAIIFIDEFHSIAASDGINDKGLARLLTEVSGYNAAKNHGVLLIGATNHYEKLAPAIIRSGRIDRVVEIPLFNKQQSKAIIEYYFKPFNFQKTLFDEIVNFGDLMALPADTVKFCTGIINNYERCKKTESLYKIICTQLVLHKEFIIKEENDKQQKSRLKELLSSLELPLYYVKAEQKKDFQMIYKSVFFERYRKKIEDAFKRNRYLLSQEAWKAIVREKIDHYKNKEAKNLQEFKILCQKIYSRSLDIQQDVINPLVIIDFYEQHYKKEWDDKKKKNNNSSSASICDTLAYLD